MDRAKVERARSLLLFAIRFYTRHVQAAHAKIGIGGRLITRDEQFWIDNGERSIHVTIRFGPFWDEEQGDDR
jgi:hypothetical protein